MNVDRIKKELEELNSDSGDRKDYSKIFWSPEYGDNVARIVPSKFDPEFPFTELEFHYGIGKFPMIALTNFGKQDPVVDFVNELKKTDDKDNWSLAGKISPKTRYFAPVVVRGEEDKGVRLWSFGVSIYKALLDLARDEEVGDYTDVINGRDLKIKKVKGNPYPETTVNIKIAQSPLSEDADQVDTWLKEQPDPNDSFTVYDYDYIKRQLKGYLNPDAKKDDEPKEDKKEESKGSYTLNTTKKPATAKAADEFDELFD